VEVVGGVVDGVRIGSETLMGRGNCSIGVTGVVSCELVVVGSFT
jgi:hypothetical protein